MAKNKKGHPSTSRVIIFLMTVSSEIFVYVCMKKRKDSKKGKKEFSFVTRGKKIYILNRHVREKNHFKEIQSRKKGLKHGDCKQSTSELLGQLSIISFFYVYRKLGLWVRGSLLFFISLYLSHSLIFPSSICFGE